MSELKSEFKNDNEFKCIRRIACKLGLSMPESDDEVLRLTHYRRIESSINKLFNDTITEQDKVISELKVEASEYNQEWKNAMLLLKQKNEEIVELVKLLDLTLSSACDEYSCSEDFCEKVMDVIAKHKQSKGE